MDKIKVLKIVLCVSLAFLVTALLVFAVVTAVSSKDDNSRKEGKTSEKQEDIKTADNPEKENVKTDDKDKKDEVENPKKDDNDDIKAGDPTETPTEKPEEPDNNEITITQAVPDNIVTPIAPDNNDNVVTPAVPDNKDDIVTPIVPDDNDITTTPVVPPDSVEITVTPVIPEVTNVPTEHLKPDDKDKDIPISEIEGVESENGGILYRSPHGNGKLVCIDPGHQTKGNYKEEPVAPGSSETKPKVSSGTSGVSTKLPEYKLNLTVSMQLKDELLSRGYDVVMTRIINDVDITNIERAMVANNNNADVFIRVHANSDDRSSTKGILTISPTSSNRYVSGIYNECYLLSQCVLNCMENSTGSTGGIIWKTDTMSGINWSEVPVTIVEMGYMSNPDEDRKLSDPDYQKKLVKGMADGIDDFFVKKQ